MKLLLTGFEAFADDIRAIRIAAETIVAENAGETASKGRRRIPW